ncbi:hypothetical protein CRUP_030723 [Coryphaenoides rupestris]|nr:hypothetical protein CRUP_030723 [Coryphaenoides rupestris]
MEEWTVPLEVRPSNWSSLWRSDHPTGPVSGGQTMHLVQSLEVRPCTWSSLWRSDHAPGPVSGGQTMHLVQSLEVRPSNWSSLWRSDHPTGPVSGVFDLKPLSLPREYWGFHSWHHRMLGDQVRVMV